MPLPLDSLLAEEEDPLDAGDMGERLGDAEPG
jgi:hypothetical protein